MSRSRQPEVVLSSIKDPPVAAARALRSRAERQGAGRCLLEGRALVDQVFQSGVGLDFVLRAQSADEEADQALSDRLHEGAVVVHRVGDGVMRQINGGPRPLPWLGVAALRAEVSPDRSWGGFAVVCDGVADPGNLGTLARSAQALGVEDLVLTDLESDLTSRRVLDASRGAVLSLRTRRFPDPAAALGVLRQAGFQIVVTSPRGRQLQSLAELDPRPVALVVGAESDGVSEDSLRRADLVVAIPMAGSMESLNVGVAAGISIYELQMKMVISMIEDKVRATVGREVAVAGRFIREALDQAMQAAAGLSATEVIGLMMVAAERRSPIADISRDLGTADPETALSLLLQRGWLAREGDALVITAAGEQSLAGLWPIQQQVERQLLDGLSDDEQTQLARLLRTVQTNATAMINTP